MHTPGHNPFLVQGGEPYLGEISFEGTSAEGYDPIQFQLPGLYQYQGINTDIMSALTNIFSGADGGVMELLPGTWQDLVALSPNSDFTEDDVLSDIAQEYIYGPEGVTFEYQFGSELGGGPSGSIDLGPGFFANIFDPESLAATLSELGGPGVDIGQAEVKALTPEMIEKTTAAYYSPYEEAERASLVERKGKALSGASTGGFAGSAGRQSGLSGAERLYQGGYGDLLADIEKMKAQSTEDVLNTIYGWQELMSQIS